ncbi:MAG: hypothetical protein GXY76_20750 [Chloroflexi bacterium]|nr:hypothetical protein [Chloroflexota bacterium]
MLKMNKSMKEALAKAGQVKKLTGTLTVSNALKLFWPQFVEASGCVLRQREPPWPEELGPMYQYQHDRTDFEASVNEIEIGDYINRRGKHPLEDLALAMKVIQVWECKLKRQFPDYRFHILCSYQDDEDGWGANMRFYRLREEERALVDGDIENSSPLAVLVSEF